MNHPKLHLVFCIIILACPLLRAGERWLFIGDSITQAGHYVDYVESWFLLNEKDVPEIIDLGLSSETISGLSEPDHAYGRPYLHDRLDRVLERTRPDLVIACYGMNCGIYHPFAEERFAAYKTGIRKLVEMVQATGADIILLTPPTYAGRVRPKDAPSEDQSYGYRTPAPDYDDVLAAYGEWIMSLDGTDGIRAYNIRPGLERFMEESYPVEPVHPATYGHKLMAEALLQALGKPTGSELLETGKDTLGEDPEWNLMLELVRLQRETYDRSLLNDIGHANPSVMERFRIPLPEAEELVKAVDAGIEVLLGDGPE